MNLKKINTNNLFNSILVIFLLIQPIFDLKIFYNSISTLIRVVIIFSLFAYYFFTSNNKKKYLIFVYPCLLIIYFIFHHINALNFNSLVPGNFNYSIIKESLYFIKMLSPFLLIYSIYKSNLEKKELLKIIKILVCVIGLTIIISNTFVFSYGSYSDEPIKASFISWFSQNDFVYQDLASKGLFEYANQISAILLMFLPFCLSAFLHNKKTYNLLVLIINIFSLFLLGTKVSVLGIFLVFAYTIFVFVFNHKFIFKQKTSYLAIVSTVIILISYSLIVSYNPIFMRIDETKTIEASSDSVVTEEIVETNNSSSDITIQNPTDSISFIAQNYTNKQIKSEFITQSYPYEYDSEFWLKIFNEPLSNRVDYRFMELSMIKRVVEINNNKFDKYLGITNTRIQNIFNIERDFVVQYYALGIIGLILIFLPYICLLIWYVYVTLKNKLKSLTVENLLAFISILMAFGISYFSGNLLNSLSFTIYFALLIDLLLDKNSSA